MHIWQHILVTQVDAGAALTFMLRLTYAGLYNAQSRMQKEGPVGDAMHVLLSGQSSTLSVFSIAIKALA